MRPLRTLLWAESGLLRPGPRAHCCAGLTIPQSRCSFSISNKAVTQLEGTDLRRLVLSTVSATFLIACQATPIELTEDEKAAMAAEVNVLVDAEWLASTDPVDFDKMMSLVHDTDPAAFSFNGGVVRSHSTMENVFGAHFAGISREPATITDSMTVVLGPDAVYAIRAGTFVSIDTAGNSGPLTPFVQTLVWVKRDGVWKLLFGHGPPLEEAM